MFFFFLFLSSKDRVELEGAGAKVRPFFCSFFFVQSHTRSFFPIFFFLLRGEFCFLDSFCFGSNELKRSLLGGVHGRTSEERHEERSK